MAEYRLSRSARTDLKKIAAYSLAKFGLETARGYRATLFEAFDRLVLYPDSGLQISHIKAGVRKLVVESHTVYYILRKYGILIERILHQNQDPLRHL